LLSKPPVSTSIKVAYDAAVVTFGTCEKTNVPRSRTHGFDYDGVTNTPAIGNRITQNTFTANAGNAIDLAGVASNNDLGDGISLNDGSTNANAGNTGLDYPVVTSAIVSGGTVLSPATPYRVTVNSFLATGGDNFSVFAQGTSLLGGAQDLDALIAYFAAFKAPNAPYDPASPALNKPRIKRLD
jgi:2',3'-cyclic-nucleotide 2'-phosphodiesterase (5'-nucleotidase family)